MPSINCPKCGSESAFQEAGEITCSNCIFEKTTDPHKWVEPLNPVLLQAKLDFEVLANLEKPFFRLEPGQFYVAKAEFGEGEEIISILPLAVKKGKNIGYCLFEANLKLKEHPQQLIRLLCMTFDEVEMYIHDSKPNTTPFRIIKLASGINNELIDDKGFIYYHISKIDEL